MRFEMDDTLLDEILFYMENQDGEFLLDTQEANVIDVYNNDSEEEQNFDDDRFISLPEWDSQDGYRLMESFSSGLKNPIVRQELTNALNRNKGVFRAFRDVLSQYPEAEKMWYAHKERNMKGAVLVWYNALREEWGLEPVGIEPEDNSSLIFEDFIIRQGTEDFSFIAETVSGDPAGEVKANNDISSTGDQILHVNYLEVNPVYRGMGLGKALLGKILEKADKQKLDVSIDLPSASDFFSRSLHLENFQPVMKRFFRKSGK
ncbi:MAG: GNAT family N-acetyltransferase [Treponema sp.]|jgi:ribosomal protein S18 acetylase RimI-like enzyme|nr:GNAT family N-acetyltransferase [Treponema sp.]